jgi:2-phosphoglycerate kinase
MIVRRDKKNLIVILTGGSFQGKSVISNRVASKLCISGVVTTDLIRNILKITNPLLQNIYGTTTYLLSKEELEAQKRNVSAVTKNLIKIYEIRGEHMIFEGMHFSNNFLKWASKNQYCCICLNNTLGLNKRIVLKSKTRSTFRFINPLLKEFEFGPISKKNVNNTAYMNYASRINEIHNNILNFSKKNNFHIVNFENIQIAIKEVLSIIKTHNKQFYPNN